MHNFTELVFLPLLRYIDEIEDLMEFLAGAHMLQFTKKFELVVVDRVDVWTGSLNDQLSATQIGEEIRTCCVSWH